MSEEKDTETSTASEEHRSSVGDDIRAAMAQLESAPEEASGGEPQAAEAADSDPAKQERVALEKDPNQSEGKAQKVSKGPSVEAGKSATTNLSAVTAPISWSAEKRQLFSTLPPDVQSYIVEREKEAERLISQKSEEYNQATRVSKEFDQVLEPYKQKFAERRVSPTEAIRYLLKANDYLETNPREALRRLAEMHGLSLEEVAQQSAEEVDPQIQNLRRELDELRGFHSQFQQAQQQQYLSQLNQYITQFEAATDEQGNKKYPHVADKAFESMMATEVKKLRSLDPQMPLDKVLTTAYDNTVWLHPELREAEIKKRAGIAEARRISEEKAKAAEARKRSSSVTGSPSGAAKAMSTGSIRGDIEAAFEALGR